MSGREGAVFQSSITELQEVLASERLSDDVANLLYQSKGIISLEDVKNIRAIDVDEDKAHTLLALLHQVIQNDKSQFEEIAKSFDSYEKLKPVTNAMQVKLCESAIHNCGGQYGQEQGLKFKKYIA